MHRSGPLTPALCIDRRHGGQAFGDIVDTFPINESGGDGMPFRGMSAMEQKREFVEFAMSEGANIRELCRRFRISPTTGYKWLSHNRDQGSAGLIERSRRPKASPRRTAAA